MKGPAGRKIPTLLFSPSRLTPINITPVIQTPVFSPPDATPCSPSLKKVFKPPSLGNKCFNNENYSSSDIKRVVFNVTDIKTKSSIIKPPNRAAPLPPSAKVKIVHPDAEPLLLPKKELVEEPKGIDIVTLSNELILSPKLGKPKLNEISINSTLNKNVLKFIEDVKPQSPDNKDKATESPVVGKLCLESEALPALQIGNIKMTAGDSLLSNSALRLGEEDGGNLELKKISPIISNNISSNKLTPTNELKLASSIIQLRPKSLELGSITKLTDQQRQCSSRDIRREKKKGRNDRSLSASSATPSNTNLRRSAVSSIPTRQEIKEAKEKFKVLSARIQKSRAEGISDPSLNSDYTALKSLIKCNFKSSNFLAWQQSQSEMYELKFDSSKPLAEVQQQMTACKLAISKLAKRRREVKCPDDIELMTYGQIVDERAAVKQELANLQVENESVIYK